METLSIAPAVALMYPAAIPFICVLLLLSSIRLLPKKWLKSPLLVADLVILSGIFLVFAVFDPGSIRHFFDPDRPMDWIPLLASAIFILRHLFPGRSLFPLESVGVILGLLLLTLPILRQDSLFQGAVSYISTLAVWLGIRFIYPVDRIKGLDPLFLLPPFFTAAALAVLSPLSGSLLVGQLAGGLAAVFGAMLLSAFFGTRISGVEPGWVIGALLVIGLRYVDISPVVISSLAGALLVGGLAGRVSSFGRKAGTGKRTLIVAGVSILPLVAAIIVAVRSLKDQGGGY